MENPASPAEELPALYRLILDGIADLERLGRRRDALRLRGDARDAYSASWNDANRRRLLLVHRRIQRLVAGGDIAPARRRSGWRSALRAVSTGR